MPPTALLRRPGPLLADGLVTHIERVPVDGALALRQWEAYVAVLESVGWDLVSESQKLEGCVTCLSVRLRT